jgi:hypothetical protein
MQGWSRCILAAGYGIFAPTCSGRAGMMGESIASSPAALLAGNWRALLRVLQVAIVGGL